jgi:hypothetical protein
MDDTIDTSRQGHEDTLMALIEAGMMEGMRALNELDAAQTGEGTLIFYRMPRDVVTEGARAGQAVAEALVLLGQLGAEGRVILAFDGWADDPRELFQIPVVVEFCAGLLLGPDKGQRSTTHARGVLDVLVDEIRLAERTGSMEFVSFTAGRHWLVACAYPLACYMPTPGEAGKFDRDLVVNLGITNALRAGAVPPGYGLPGGSSD